MDIVREKKKKRKRKPKSEKHGEKVANSGPFIDIDASRIEG